MAAPIIGGLVTSFALELLVYPVIYETWKWHTEVKPSLAAAGPSPPAEPLVERA
jgi:copper/silver efflux system protein